MGVLKLIILAYQILGFLHPIPDSMEYKLPNPRIF